MPVRKNVNLHNCSWKHFATYVRRLASYVSLSLLPSPWCLYQWLSVLHPLRLLTKKWARGCRTQHHAHSWQEHVAKISSKQQALVATLQRSWRVGLKKNSIQVWKTKYLAVVSWKWEIGESGDIFAKHMPSKKCELTLPAGEKLDMEVKCYIQAVWEGGGVMTTTITVPKLQQPL